MKTDPVLIVVALYNIWNNMVSTSKQKITTKTVICSSQKGLPTEAQFLEHQELGQPPPKKIGLPDQICYV